MAEVKKDNELRSVILIIGLVFTLPMLIIDFTYSNLGAMFKKPDLWAGIMWVIIHLLIAYVWYLVIKYWQDPNKNLLRVFLIILHVLAIGLTMSHRAGWLEREQVIIDSKNNK